MVMICSNGLKQTFVIMGLHQFFQPLCDCAHKTFDVNKTLDVHHLLLIGCVVGKNGMSCGLSLQTNHFPTEGLDHEDQLRQKRLGRDHSDQHDQAGEQPKGNGGDEVRQSQDAEADGDGDRGIGHSVSDTPVTGMHDRKVTSLPGEFRTETMDIVNGVVHRDPHADGGDGDGHHIQGQVEPPHDAQHDHDRQ